MHLFSWDVPGSTLVLAVLLWCAIGVIVLQQSYRTQQEQHVANCAPLLIWLLTIAITIVLWPIRPLVSFIIYRITLLVSRN